MLAGTSSTYRAVIAHAPSTGFFLPTALADHWAAHLSLRVEHVPGSAPVPKLQRVDFERMR